MSEEATFRARRIRPFTQIDNEMVKDQRLSIQALGLGVRMLSLDPDKVYSAKWIQSMAGVGRDKLKKLFGELETAGYLQKEQTHDKKGKFSRNSYVIVDIPSQSPFTEKPSTVLPSTENQSTASIDKNNNIPPIIPQGGEGESDLLFLFDRFWHLYPRKVSKEAAWRAWKKLAPDILLCSRMSVALKRQMQSEQWTRDGGRYIPYPSSWINGRRWEDEPDLPERAAPERRREEDQWIT